MLNTPLTPADDPDDPVNIILQFIKYIEGQRNKDNTLPINDRDRFLITTVLALLSDPNHHIGKLFTRNIFKLWIERGGKVPIRGEIARALRERDEFEFAVQYLYDYGMPIKDIAMALGADKQTVRNMLKYVKNKDLYCDFTS